MSDDIPKMEVEHLNRVDTCGSEPKEDNGCALEARIDRLRGQLQNCVNHLECANRRDRRKDYRAAIESANKALYETL